MIEGNMPRTNV